MTWLDRLAFLTEVRDRGLLPGAPQRIGFALSAAALRSEIGVDPVVGPPEEQLPAPVERWYGRTDGRHLTLDVYPDYVGGFPGLSDAEVQTSYPQVVADYDWVTLLELQCLPSAILSAPIMFVESRNSSPSHAVYRDDSRGFASAFYNAACEREALRLLEWLERSGRAQRFFIGEPERAVDWLVVRLSGGRETVAARYTGRSSTIATACCMSRGGDDFRVLCSDSVVDSRTYIVSNGRVVA